MKLLPIELTLTCVPRGTHYNENQLNKTLNSNLPIAQNGKHIESLTRSREAFKIIYINSCREILSCSVVATTLELKVLGYEVINLRVSLLTDNAVQFISPSENWKSNYIRAAPSACPRFPINPELVNMYSRSHNKLLKITLGNDYISFCTSGMPEYIASKFYSVINLSALLYIVRRHPSTGPYDIDALAELTITRTSMFDARLEERFLMGMYIKYYDRFLEYIIPSREVASEHLIGAPDRNGGQLILAQLVTSDGVCSSLDNHVLNIRYMYESYAMHAYVHKLFNKYPELYWSAVNSSSPAISSIVTSFISEEIIRGRAVAIPQNMYEGKGIDKNDEYYEYDDDEEEDDD